MVLHDLTPAPGRPAPSDLAGAVAALAAHEPLQAVELKYGLIDLRKAVGLDFYYSARIHLGDRLFEAAAALGDGQAAGPILVGAIPHLLVMEKNQPPHPENFEASRERVLKDELEHAKQTVERADETYLRSKADILVSPEYR